MMMWSWVENSTYCIRELIICLSCRWKEVTEEYNPHGSMFGEECRAAAAIPHVSKVPIYSIARVEEDEANVESHASSHVLHSTVYDQKGWRLEPLNNMSRQLVQKTL